MIKMKKMKIKIKKNENNVNFKIYLVNIIKSMKYS